jgi:hypothetical protein
MVDLVAVLLLLPLVADVVQLLLLHSTLLLLLTLLQLPLAAVAVVASVAVVCSTEAAWEAVAHVAVVDAYSLYG